MAHPDSTKLRKLYGALFDDVSAALFRADPIGLNFEENTDEYDTEARTILPRLTHCSSVEDALVVIHEEFEHWFGAERAGHRSRYVEVAAEVWAIWRARSAGKLIRLDPTAESALPDLVAFLSRPADAPVYHGFPLVEESRIDGWVFGAISDYQDSKGCDWGDAFVVAPDGTRAGIVWQVDHFEPQVVCPPDDGRWGVYGFAYPTPIRTTGDFVRMCHSFLPELKRRHAAAMAGR